MRFDRYVALFGAALLLAQLSPAVASGLDEEHDLERYLLLLADPYSWMVLKPAGAPNLPSGQAAAAAPRVARAATFHLANYGATLEAGEPNPGGQMTRTLWGGFSLPQASRVVIHTVGSDIFNTSAAADMDTVLAAYRGSVLNSLTLVASNDNRSIPGFGLQKSLVQFTAAANTPYRIQVGAKAQREGDVFLNVFIFPPGGGVSAWLARTGGLRFDGRDYICQHYSGSPPCPYPEFVVHNSTSKTLKVHPSSSVGGAFLTPAPVTLAPGAIATVKFLYNSSFDKTTPRTLAGFFTFAGYEGTTQVSTARVRLLIVIKPVTAPPNVLSAGGAQQVRAGRINEGLKFKTWIKNSGSQPATGCHARSEVFSRLKTVWQRINPSTGATIGALDAPATIPAGQTYWFNVTVASQESRLAFPTSFGEIVLDCANTAPVTFNDRNRFDLTARGLYDPADIVTTFASPTGAVLNVPAGKTAAFNVRAVNQGSAGTIVAIPQYVYPFTDTDPASHFTTSICQTSSISGGCLAARSGSVQFAAAVNSTKTFRVFVRAPTVNPGYNPDARRVFLDFKQNPPKGSSKAPVGTASIAVKRS